MTTEPDQLVREGRVHRDVYVSARVFEQERARLFRNAWIYVGHDSQVPSAGDYVTVELGDVGLILLRDGSEDGDAGLRVLMNRCAHKGVRMLDDRSGHVGRMLRCPYHAWTYRLDGRLIGQPIKQGYEGTPLARSPAADGLARVGAMAVHRGFVFVRLAPEGIGFTDYFGPALAALDNMADRSPLGRLEVVGRPQRNLVHANWKTYIENINDSVHPPAAHESVIAAARHVWRDQPADAVKPMAIEQILPFASGYDFFDGMGARTMPNGHSFLGVNFNIHTSYGGLSDYEKAMNDAWGEERAAEILGFRSQNSVLYPSVSVKSSPLAIRVLRPLAVDRTIVESWAFRAVGAPEVLAERGLTYNRLVFSPMSAIAHDDVHLFESIQRALAAEGNDWIDLNRDLRDAESPDDDRVVNGTNEALMRNQFRAWVRFMNAPANGDAR
ncbi:MAG: Rieske 2Fe-2S domain-containing protein [Burkholderiaceae bacterium]|nr:Rieske 2Fe-2S domain-containing protein [Burkholderiaceae bacterium]